MAKVDMIQDIKDIDTWWVQILFWRSHLDIFLRDVMKVNLKDTQQVIARACSEATNIKLIKSRGYGKSWLIAWIAIAIAILYPNTQIGIVSQTKTKATIVLRKINMFVDIYPELLPNIKIKGRNPVVLTSDKGIVYFKNGSKIESYGLSEIVGERTKVLIVDEAPLISEDDLSKNAKPTMNYTREVCTQLGYKDFGSKIICITSAPLKSNYFYMDFVKTLQEMRGGNTKAFACALDYKSAIRVGISDAEFFEGEKKTLPAPIFDSEYATLCLGAEANTVFPYELTASVRKLKRVEYVMPKGSKSYYVMAVDLATSNAKHADNAVIAVVKCTDKEDGTIIKQLVYMRSYHGRRLELLAEEVRKTFVRFVNIQKVVFDHRGLGDSFPAFFTTPWVDPMTQKEYPAWCLDDQNSHFAEPMLYSFKANSQLNQELVSALRISLEQKTLMLPIESRSILSDDFDSAEGLESIGAGSSLSKEERAIFLEADALQVEMGNLVMKVGSGSGSVIYDVAKSTQHKDRYSALAMAVWYISKLEAVNKKRIAARGKGAPCIGLVSYFG